MLLKAHKTSCHLIAFAPFFLNFLLLVLHISQGTKFHVSAHMEKESDGYYCTFAGCSLSMSMFRMQLKGWISQDRF